MTIDNIVTSNNCINLPSNQHRHSSPSINSTKSLTPFLFRNSTACTPLSSLIIDQKCCFNHCSAEQRPRKTMCHFISFPSLTSFISKEEQKSRIGDEPSVMEVVEQLIKCKLQSDVSRIGLVVVNGQALSVQFGKKRSKEKGKKN